MSGSLHYCSFCGHKLTMKKLLDGSNEKYCSHCDYVFFNSPNPAIIIAVINSGNILLTRGVRWKHSFWGLIAGHIHLKETAEQAALREVHEEVGVNLLELQILRTFIIPARKLLMIAFVAKTRDEDLLKSDELAQAKWFNIEDQLPIRQDSISSQIIEQLRTNRRAN